MTEYVKENHVHFICVSAHHDEAEEMLTWAPCHVIYSGSKGFSTEEGVLRPHAAKPVMFGEDDEPEVPGVDLLGMRMMSVVARWAGRQQKRSRSKQAPLEPVAPLREGVEVLACLDGSRPAGNGLRLVARWLEHSTFTVTAFHIEDEQKLGFLPLNLRPARIQADAEALLTCATKPEMFRVLVEPKAHARSAQQICARVLYHDALRAQYVVLGRYGVKGHRDGSVGSTSRYVFAQSDATVILAAEELAPRGGVFLVALKLAERETPDAASARAFDDACFLAAPADPVEVVVFCQRGERLDSSAAEAWCRQRVGGRPFHFRVIPRKPGLSIASALATYATSVDAAFLCLGSTRLAKGMDAGSEAAKKYKQTIAEDLCSLVTCNVIISHSAN